MKAQSILVPVDYTDVSHDALRFAMNLAHDMHSQVTVLHIEPSIPRYDVGIEPYVDLNRQPDEMLRELQLTVGGDIDETVPFELQVAVGEPTQRILEYADMHETDLIVMGTHGRTGFSRLFMGSVAESVIRQAHCPVFIVKHNSHTEATT
jgi:nucleotide-binding universal stress UspA family protein